MNFWCKDLERNRQRDFSRFYNRYWEVMLLAMLVQLELQIVEELTNWVATCLLGAKCEIHLTIMQILKILLNAMPCQLTTGFKGEQHFRQLC